MRYFKYNLTGPRLPKNYVWIQAGDIIDKDDVFYQTHIEFSELLKVSWTFIGQKYTESYPRKHVFDSEYGYVRKIK